MELVAKYAAEKYLFATSFSLGLFFVALWQLQTTSAYSIEWWGHIGVLTLFGVMCGVAIRRFFETRPVLIVNQDGILDRRVSDVVIPWTAIDAASEHYMARQHFISLHLNKPRTSFVSSNIQNFSLSVDKLVGLGDIHISLHGLDKPANAISTTISRHIDVSANS